jgi:hypothetical protein
MKRLTALLLAILLCFTVLPGQNAHAEAGTLRGFDFLMEFMRENGEEDRFLENSIYYSWKKALNEEGTVELRMESWDAKFDEDLCYVMIELYYRDEQNDKQVLTCLNLRRTYITMMNGGASYREMDLDWNPYSPGHDQYIMVYSAGINPFSLNTNGAGFMNEHYTGPAEAETQNKQKAYAAIFCMLDYINDLASPAGYDIARDFNFWNYAGHGENHIYFTSELIKPSCVEQGNGTSVCLYCGKQRSDIYPATGHSFSDWVVEREADCEPGRKSRACSVCGYEETAEIPAPGHAWTLTELLSEGETLHDSIGLYTCSRCGETKEARLCAGEVFSDVPKESSWAHDPIDWACFRGITGGTTANTFTPNGIVTRAEAMTFLWAALEHPDFTLEESPFQDVKPKHWFYDSVLWAVENQVTGGVEPGRFAPGLACSRAQIVTFLWAAEGKPEPETQESPFSDVKENDWFRSAVLWAAENNITGGVAPGRFGPDQTCTRAQAVTFLRSAYPVLTAEETTEEPTKPTEPADPINPEEPTEPNDPSNPEEPTDPTEPDEP